MKVERKIPNGHTVLKQTSGREEKPKKLNAVRSED